MARMNSIEWEGDPNAQILCINTAGKGGADALRMRRLASRLEVPCAFYDLDKSARGQSFKSLWKLITVRPWRLIYQEGTGIAGGFNLIRAARLRGARYIISSGDPISGFFRVTKGRAAGTLFGIYERLLMRSSAGFVGWTPYLTGRALELGAPRAVTVEGAVDASLFRPLPESERQAIRTEYGLTPGHLVCGVVGSLRWTPRLQYGYGLELVEAARRLKRDDISFLIVGDGTGKPILQERVPEVLKKRVLFTGRIPEAEVVRAMNAMHVGFITQTLDELGSYRLTTKLPEYLATGLPIAMSPIPGFYDYVGEEAGWALPALPPGSTTMHEQLATWLDSLSREEVAQKASHCRAIAEERFDYARIASRFRLFVHHLL